MLLLQSDGFYAAIPTSLQANSFVAACLDLLRSDVLVMRILVLLQSTDSRATSLHLSRIPRAMVSVAKLWSTRGTYLRSQGDQVGCDALIGGLKISDVLP